MLYRYETHCHSSQCSACARSTAREMVQGYHKAGYAGLILTDHFIYGNTAVDRSLPWAERMQCYYDAYLEANAEGDALDFDVIFAIEHAYGDGKEVLLYGIDLPFLLNNPDIPEISFDELIRRVHDYGALAIQAHPFRDRAYINMNVAPRMDLIDGIEVYNAKNLPGNDKQALALAQQGDYIMLSGGDIHIADDALIGAAGIVLPYRIHDSRELVTALRHRDHQFLVEGRLLPEIRDEDLP